MDRESTILLSLLRISWPEVMFLPFLPTLDSGMAAPAASPAPRWSPEAESIVNWLVDKLRTLCDRAGGKFYKHDVEYGVFAVCVLPKEYKLNAAKVEKAPGSLFLRLELLDPDTRQIVDAIDTETISQELARELNLKLEVVPEQMRGVASQGLVEIDKSLRPDTEKPGVQILELNIYRSQDGKISLASLILR